MAWRIDEHLIRGEIDNRVRGRVTGLLWFAGREGPVRLQLEGDAWRDLAGRRLRFTNPRPESGDLSDLAAEQTGVVGDITASRKVRVPDVSMEELRRRFARREPFPWHWGNSLYLEWFSAANGRIVIESTEFQLQIDPESTWDMTETEEDAQRVANAGAMDHFMQRLSESLQQLPAEEVPAEDRALQAEGDEPLTEQEAEEIQAESDRLTDRVQARMDAEGPDADLGRIIEEEIDRARRERGEPELTSDERAEQEQWLEELEASATGDDVADPPGELEEDESGEHPLALRARDLALQVSTTLDANRWVPDTAGPEHPMIELQVGLMKAAAKLSGALDRRTWPPTREDCATTIVWLKRARRYLADTRLAAEAAAGQTPAPGRWIDQVSGEARELIDEITALVVQLRERLQQGFE